MSKKELNDLMAYINKYGYFHKGVHYVDMNGTQYRVEGIMKFLTLQGIIK